MAKKTPREYKPGQYIRVKLSGGRIEKATIKAVIYLGSTQKLQVDFGHGETALICALASS